MIDRNRTYTAQADGDLSASQGLVLQKGAANANDLEDCALATDGTIAGGQEIVGLLVRGNTDNGLITVMQEGVVENALAGAAIVAGTKELTCDATSRLIPAAAGDQVVAYYRGSRDAVAGDRITVYVSLSRWAVA